MSRSCAAIARPDGMVRMFVRLCCLFAIIAVPRIVVPMFTCLIALYIQYLGVPNLLNVDDVEVVVSDELNEHPRFRVRGYAVHVYCGDAHYAHFSVRGVGVVGLVEVLCYFDKFRTLLLFLSVSLSLIASSRIFLDRAVFLVFPSSVSSVPTARSADAGG